jgi:ACS family allantoate permease-like MFS transporter
MKRDCEPHDDTYDDVYIDRVGTDGGSEKVKIDKVRRYRSLISWQF